MQKCVECGEYLGTGMIECPKCGCPIQEEIITTPTVTASKKSRRNVSSYISLALGIIVLLIGIYVANQKTANSAKAKVVKDTECKSDYVEKVLKKDLTTKNAFVSSNNLIEKEKLSENIVEAIEELEAGYGVYINEELYCSFKSLTIIGVVT